MFHAVGTSPDPQRPLRLAVATVVAGLVYGLLWLTQATAVLGWGLLGAFWPDLALDDEDPWQVVDEEMVEVVFEEPALSEEELPPPPPPEEPPEEAPPVEEPPADPTPPPEVSEPPPPPVDEPSAAVLGALTEDLSGAVVGGVVGATTLEGFEAAEDAELALGEVTDTEIAEPSEEEWAAFVEAVERARARGLLRLRRADADIELPAPERDPWDTDPPEDEPEPPLWDGLFGPRDVRLLLEALEAEEARRAASGVATGPGQLGKGGGYRLSASHFGGGAFGGGRMVLRIPPTREILSVVEPRYPREARRQKLGRVECTFFIDVDGYGLADDVETVDCPEVLEPEARAAIAASRWKLADDLAEMARVRHTVVFDR